MLKELDARFFFKDKCKFAFRSARNESVILFDFNQHWNRELERSKIPQYQLHGAASPLCLLEPKVMIL